MIQFLSAIESQAASYHANIMKLSKTLDFSKNSECAQQKNLSFPTRNPIENKGHTTYRSQDFDIQDVIGLETCLAEGKLRNSEYSTL